jgi:hypothetical protein
MLQKVEANVTWITDIGINKTSLFLDYLLVFNSRHLTAYNLTNSVGGLASIGVYRRFVFQSFQAKHYEDKHNKEIQHNTDQNPRVNPCACEGQAVYASYNTPAVHRDIIFM